jgi:hypothetical protein
MQLLMNGVYMDLNTQRLAYLLNRNQSKYYAKTSLNVSLQNSVARNTQRKQNIH